MQFFGKKIQFLVHILCSTTTIQLFLLSVSIVVIRYVGAIARINLNSSILLIFFNLRKNHTSVIIPYLLITDLMELN